MEAKFSQLTLDVIGLSVFSYNFDSLTSGSPVIDALYTALKEAEHRFTDTLPYWKARGSTFPQSHILELYHRFIDMQLCCYSVITAVPLQVKAQKAVVVIREAVERLIAQCKEMVDAEGERINNDEEVCE